MPNTQQHTTNEVEEIAEEIASRLDGRTVTSHAHYREMLAKELRDVFLAQKKQIEERVDKMISQVHSAQVGSSEYQSGKLNAFAAVKEALQGNNK